MQGHDGGAFRRVLRGIGGQAYFRFVYLIYTIALVPILIGAWGVDGYGTWLVLTALSSYMAASSAGLSNTSTVEMVQAVGGGDFARARLAFQQSINILLLLTLSVIGPMLLAAYALPLASFLNLPRISNFDIFLVMGCMAVQVTAATIRLVIGAAISSTGSYGVSESVTATAKAVEFGLIVLFVSVWRGGFVTAACVVAAMSCVDLGINFLLCRRIVPWARPDFTRLDIAWARNFLHPTIGNFVLSFAINAVVIQAPRIVLSVIAGSAAVAVFGVYASAMRLMEQFTTLITSTLIMEIAREIGRDHIARVAFLVRSGLQFVTTCAVLVSAALLTAGPLVFDKWTRGKVPFEYGVMMLFLAMSTISQVGKIGQFYLISSNRILVPSLLMLAGACVGVAAGGVLASWMGVAGMALGGLVGEGINAFVGLVGTARGTDTSTWALLGQAARFDRGIAMLWQRVRRAA